MAKPAETRSRRFPLSGTDCDGFGPFGHVGLCFGCLVRCAFGFDVAELTVTALYAQGYSYAHILGNCSDQGAFQRCQQCEAVFFYAPVHRTCPVQGMARGHHPLREVVVRASESG